MVGWLKSEVVVSLSVEDRLLLKRVADCLDSGEPAVDFKRRLREPALTVDELAVLDDVDGGWVSSEVGATALRQGSPSVLKRLLTVNDPHIRGKHLSVRECPERFVSAEDIV